MRKLLAKIAGHKIIAALVAVAVVGGGTAGGVAFNGGNNGNTCNGSCITSVPPGQQGTTTTSTGAANNVCPVPGSRPKFIAIFVQGIASYVLARTDQIPGTDDVAKKIVLPAPGPGPAPEPGKTEPPNNNQKPVGYTEIPAIGSFNAAKASYCATTPNEQPQNGELPPDNSNIILRSMADGWLNYSYDNSGFGNLESDASSDGPSRVTRAA